jgi:hypothetical protein
MPEQRRLDHDRLDPIDGGEGDATFAAPRGQVARNGLLAVAALLLGTAAGLGTGRPAGAASSPRQDRRILQFLLKLEHLQADFYAAAVSGGQLDGELRDFAEVVGEHEERHVALLEERLGTSNGRRPAPDFGDAVTDANRFARTARQVEELGVAAYIGQGANLTPRVVVPISRITSVEARHAAWIADFLGRHPAPRAADKAQTATQVEGAIRRLGFAT